jgi:hypothetical protein
VGTARSTDDAANEASALNAPKYKVIYAYPSDQPNASRRGRA